MPDPLAVESMRQWKDALLAREEQQMRQMAAVWVDMQERLEAALERLATEAAEGQALTPGQLARMRRYRALIAQIEDEMERYQDYAADLITSRQLDHAAYGVEQAARAVELTDPTLEGAFDRLPISAVETMAGLTADGAPVRNLLAARVNLYDAAPEQRAAIDRLTTTLLQGVTQGWNPRKTARQMAADLDQGLDKAMTIARTEQMRVYREATRQQYEASGRVAGQMRVCAHDGRVCGACLADEGHVYPLSVAIPDHPNGRCTSIPALKNRPALEWVKGKAWFDSQPEAVQASILGAGRLEAYRAGKFEFGQLITRTHHEVWGEGVIVTPLGILTRDTSDTTA